MGSWDNVCVSIYDIYDSWDICFKSRFLGSVRGGVVVARGKERRGRKKRKRNMKEEDQEGKMREERMTARGGQPQKALKTRGEG